jgi:Ran GTPase-activating protein (RanGAP) involved in mRNA processing and transport
MINADLWNELKEFNNDEPSELAFRALVALLDTWPTDDQAKAIKYAEHLLSNWPDSARVASWSWCKAASKGVVLPTWQLARSLQLMSGHLTKEAIDLTRLERHAPLEHITELKIPQYSEFKELSLLYHRPEKFRGLKRLTATDKFDDGEVRAIAGSSIWQSVEWFDTESMTDSFALREPSRIVPQLDGTCPIRHLSLRASDLMAVWDANDLPKIRSVCVFIRSLDEAKELGARKELSYLQSLSIAFRCGFSGSSPFGPFIGTVIEADEAAADLFFSNARLNQIENLSIAGYPMGYWGREGLGRLGLDALIDSGVLKRLKQLRLECLPLGDDGVAALAPELGAQLESLELVDVYCKGKGAAALIDSPCMSSLVRLDLSANRIDHDHISQLAKVKMPRLESLDLSGPVINPYYWNVGVQPILDAGAAAWANCDNANGLKRLRLSNCHLTDAGLMAIFKSSRLHALTELDLSHSSFSISGMSQIVGSRLWHTLYQLSLNDCRLDNDAIEALAGVSHAPRLRSLELTYNSIGPRGAAALASWGVLRRVWQLNLHDNVIGDEGLVALAQSPNLCRLLELDLEQDCWNSRAFTFSDEAVKILVKSTSFPHLDCMLSGCVDEYHGAAYSPGFSKNAIERLRQSEWMRPALRAATSDFSGIDEYHEQDEYDENRELEEHDFRSQPFDLNEREDEQSGHRMRQLSSNREPDRPIDELPPPKICPLPEVASDRDIIEGLEFRDPISVTDHFEMLKLSLEDDDHPLPGQVGKFLGDTLASIFRTCALGNFQVGGGSSRKNDDGHYIATDVTFYVSTKGVPDQALEFIREALWWVGAPKETEFKDQVLALTEPPMKNPARFLQLATPKITRWTTGHRIDRVPFSESQRATIRKIIAEVGAATTDTVEGDDGWTQCSYHDGGKLSIYTKYLDEADDFDTLNFLVDSLTLEVTRMVYRIMHECEFLMLPMSIASDDAVAQLVDCDWPKVKILRSYESLHELLIQGAYKWWQSS